MASFLDYLVKNKVITPEVAHQAADWKAQNERDRRSVIDLLKEEFGLSGDVLHYQVAQFYAFRIIDMNERGVRRLLGADVVRLLNGVPEQGRRLAMKHKVLPYDIAENQADKLIVVTPNPADREIADVARAFPFKRFEICYMKERDWAEYWRQVSQDHRAAPAAGNGDIATVEEAAELESVVEREIARGQLAALVENLLADAVRVGATDVHIVPCGARRTEIRFRIDGQVSLWSAIEETRTEAVAAAVKARCHAMDRFERLSAQRGSAQKVVDGSTVRFSVSALPVAARDPGAKHESLVVHLITGADQQARLEALALSEQQRTRLTEALQRRQGLFLVAGPARSGRSSTLVALLRAALRPTLTAVTVEDPIRYLLEGVQQVKVNPALPLGEAVHAIASHDPDIVLLGDLDERETMHAAVRLAASGRMVLSKVSAHDSVGALQRLLLSGVEPYLVAHGTAVVHAQRLIRRLCDGCKQAAEGPGTEGLVHLGMAPEEASSLQVYRPVGCIHCVGGFSGRAPIHETLAMTREVRDAVVAWGGQSDMQGLRELVRTQGLQTLRDGALECLRAGVTTLDEVFAALCL